MNRKSLMTLLRSFKVPIETWGTGEAKTLDHLYAEISSGEAALTVVNGKLRRYALGITVLVHYIGDGPEKKLVEKEQVFRDGRRKTRALQGNMSIGEKMRPSEDALSAAYRAFKEELKIEERLPLQVLRPFVKGPIPSISFPGIETLYYIHAFMAWIPPHLYKRDGYTEEQEDKTTYFIWEVV